MWKITFWISSLALQDCSTTLNDLRHINQDRASGKRETEVPLFEVRKNRMKIVPSLLILIFAFVHLLNLKLSSNNLSAPVWWTELFSRSSKRKPSVVGPACNFKHIIQSTYAGRTSLNSHWVRACLWKSFFLLEYMNVSNPAESSLNSSCVPFTWSVWRPS